MGDGQRAGDEMSIQQEQSRLLILMSIAQALYAIRNLIW